MDEVITKLKAATSTASNYLSDQKVAQYGSGRKDEVVASIGDNGQSWEKLFFENIYNL